MWVMGIESPGVCTRYPALGLVVNERGYISIIDDSLDASDPMSVDYNDWHGWYVVRGYAHSIPPNAYTDEQLRLLALWRLRH